MSVFHPPAETVRAQVSSILAAWGMPDDMIETTAQAMVETDLWGVDSHGVSMLMMYEGMKREGRLQIDARPRIVQETPVTAVLDGGAGLGHPVAHQGMTMAVEKARAMGVGVVTAHNSHHFGAAGIYAKIASDAGCIGIVTSTSRTVAVVPTFGTQPVLGTNPIAFAAPASANPAFLLDFATSAVALNKVKVYEFYGKTLPEGWVIDAQGDPMTEAGAAHAMLRSGGNRGGLTPLGGTKELGSHKGYGLGVVAQLLGGALAGGSFSPLRDATAGPDDPFNIGHFFLAIDPRAFRPEGAFESDADQVIDTLHANDPIDPANPVLVAGDPERITRAERIEKGIPIPKALADHIEGIAERAGVEFLLRG